MLACMNIRRYTQLQLTLLETEQSRFGSSLIIVPEVSWGKVDFKKTEVGWQFDIDNKVDIIYTDCVIESRKVSQKKTTKVV